MEGILIGTAILLVLNVILVTPLTNFSVGRRLALAGVKVSSLDQLSPDQKAFWESVAVRHFIMWDVVVLGVAGMIGGLLGYWFIGFSTQAKGWPGILAFIGMSFAGLALKGA